MLLTSFTVTVATFVQLAPSLSATLYVTLYSPALVLSKSPLSIVTLSSKLPSSLSLASLIKVLRTRLSPTFIVLLVTSSVGAMFITVASIVVLHVPVPVNLFSPSFNVSSFLS